MLILTAKPGDKFDLEIQTATETVYFTIHLKEADRGNGAKCAFDAPQNVRVHLVKRNAVAGWDRDSDQAPVPAHRPASAHRPAPEAVPPRTRRPRP